MPNRPKPRRASRPNPLDRVRQTQRLLRKEGYAGVVGRLMDRVSARVTPPGTERLWVAEADIEAAAEVAARGWVLPEPLPVEPGQPLTIAWVNTPPAPGSGGHTTMFRLISALEKAGHRCVLYLYDDSGWPLDKHEANIRAWWPWVNAEVRSAADGIEDAHAIFATAWETAYPVLGSPARGTRFYLVQDFEPSFYPAGSRSLLAEATYRFGFHGVTAGRWLSGRLQSEYGMAADPFEFGRDQTYSLDTSIAPEERTGVCFYARPGTPRRAYELAVLALRLFAKQRPDVEIHIYGHGTQGDRMPFGVTDHGLMTPEQLNGLYNRCAAGLVLSATNVSLVPHEMLAAGCIPVVNDAEHNKIVLDNEHVAYATAAPFELAEALRELVDRTPEERARDAVAASDSVRGASWEDAGDAVVRIVEDVVGRAALVTTTG
jgi:glycosyltransferase involved in cell wall biosynthesis